MSEAFEILAGGEWRERAVYQDAPAS